MRTLVVCLPLIFGFGTVAVAQNADKTLTPTVVESKAPAAATTTGGSDSTECSQGKNKRLVEVTYTNPQTKVPCEVHYKKDTEQPGHNQMIFQAAHDLGFCESKAQAFVEKLTGMGWTCAKK